MQAGHPGDASHVLHSRFLALMRRLFHDVCASPLIALMRRFFHGACASPFLALIRRLFHGICASPFLCGLFAVGLCMIFAFVLFSASYLTNDDAIMKGLLSGTHFYGAGPSEFTLYTSSILGLALKYLYTHIPHVNWYDTYLYATLCCAVFFIVKTLAENLHEKNSSYKALVLLVIPILCGVSFVGVQFTMVAGMITASGLVVFLSLFRRSSGKVTACLGKSFYFVIAVTFGVLIRDEAALGVGLVGGLFLLPLAPWRNVKKMTYLICTGVVAIGAVVAVLLINYGMTEANPEWKYRRDVNTLYGNLTLHSIFADSKTPGDVSPDLFNFSSVPDVVWSKEYHNLLLSWAPIGETNVFSPENMEKAYELLKDDISLSNRSSIGFKLFQPVKSESITPHLILLAALLLLFRDRNVFSYTAYQAVCFVLVITALSFQYRAVPYRVWYSYSVLFFSFLTVFIGSMSVSSEHKEGVQALGALTAQKALGIILIVLNVLAAYNVLYWQQRHGRMHNKIYKQLKRDFARAQLDVNNIYIVHGTTLYYATVPCKPNLLESAGLKKTIILTSTLFTRDFQRQLHKFGLPENGTIKSLVERSDVRLLAAPARWTDVFAPPKGTPFPAIADFMRNNYALEIGMADTVGFRAEVLAAFQLSVLTDQEVVLRKKLRDLYQVGTVPMRNGEYFLEFIRSALLKRYAFDYEGEDIGRSTVRVLSGVKNKVRVRAQT